VNYGGDWLLGALPLTTIAVSVASHHGEPRSRIESQGLLLS